MAGIDEGARSTRVAGLTAPAPITAPAASLNFDKPAIQTYSGANQQWGQVAAPSSYSNMAAPGSNQTWNAPTNSWQGSAAPAPSFAPPPPAAPPAPPVGGRQWFNSLGADQQAAETNKWLGGDSDYTAQVSEFDRALQTFVDRIANQKNMFNQDATDATNSTGRNQAMSLDGLGEDFGARGLSYSGMFDTEKNKTNDRFNEAKGNIQKVLSRNNSDADNRLADYKTENSISKDNAQRASLSRQAQRQALLDSSAGL